MSEPSATVCREQALLWETKAAESALPRLRELYTASAKAWTTRADQLDRFAVMKARNLKATAAS